MGRGTSKGNVEYCWPELVFVSWQCFVSGCRPFGAGIINKGYRTLHHASRDQKSAKIRMLSVELLMSAATQMNTGELCSSAQRGKLFWDPADARGW